MKSYYEGQYFEIYWILKNEDGLVDSDIIPYFTVSYVNNGVEIIIINDTFDKIGVGKYHKKINYDTNIINSIEYLVTKYGEYESDIVTEFETIRYSQTVVSKPVAKF